MRPPNMTSFRVFLETISVFLNNFTSSLQQVHNSWFSLTYIGTPTTQLSFTKCSPRIFMNLSQDYGLNFDALSFLFPLHLSANGFHVACDVTLLSEPFFSSSS